MRYSIVASGLLILCGVTAGLSQEGRDAVRHRFVERRESAPAGQRGREEQQRDSASRSTRQREPAVAPRGAAPFQKQSLDREVPDRAPVPARDDYKSIFQRIQRGMASGNVGAFAQHFGSQVYFNLRGGESGYYSANQAYYLLENYLKSRKLVYFDFSSIGESESNPYATGSAGFNVKGSREIAQIYVSLSHVGTRWVISQINIY